MLTDRHAVSPQIAPADVSGLVAAGVGSVICNRPDPEVSEDLSADAVAAACDAAGIPFERLEAPHNQVGPELAARQRRLRLDLEGRGAGIVLAYCASGTRCSVLWALGEAGHRPIEEIVARAAAAGYDLSHLAPHLG